MPKKKSWLHQHWFSRILVVAVSDSHQATFHSHIFRLSIPKLTHVSAHTNTVWQPTGFGSWGLWNSNNAIRNFSCLGVLRYPFWQTSFDGVLANSPATFKSERYKLGLVTDVRRSWIIQWAFKSAFYLSPLGSGIYLYMVQTSRNFS